MFRHLTRAFIDLIFPPACICCDAPLSSSAGILLCHKCQTQTLLIREPLCTCCGKPYLSGAGTSHLCVVCLTNKKYFNRARGVLLYKGPIREAIQRFKYQHDMSGLTTFKKLFKEADPARKLLDSADLVLPVPLHVKRLRERTFNQAAVLARCLCGQRKRIRYDILLRPGWTDPQTSKSGVNRRKGLGRAFKVMWPQAVQGRNILLVDDVFTTGTTANECARVLKKNGAKTVDVLTLARVEQ
jgi:ComF family protein